MYTGIGYVYSEILMPTFMSNETSPLYRVLIRIGMHVIVYGVFVEMGSRATLALVKEVRAGLT